MSSYTIGEAKRNLSEPIAGVAHGESVEIRRGKYPVAKLVPVAPAAKLLRKPGALKGKVYIPDDFDTWPDDIARALGIID